MKFNRFEHQTAVYVRVVGGGRTYTDFIGFTGAEQLKSNLLKKTRSSS